MLLFVGWNFFNNKIMEFLMLKKKMLLFVGFVKMIYNNILLIFYWGQGVFIIQKMWFI